MEQGKKFTGSFSVI